MANTYGDWLRQQRETAGLTQQELADIAVMTRSHIAHIEAGRRIPSKEDARRLDKALNTGDVLSSFLPTEEPAVADYFESVRQLEQQAVMIREFAQAYFPGLLQTERYARAVLSSVFPPVSEEECDRRVVTRLERARILEEPVAPVLWVLLDEALLRRPVCAEDVMAEQIMHLVGLAEAGRIRVHVLPFAVGLHPLLDGTLRLMWFDDQPPLAYTEGYGTGKVHDSPSTVRELQHRYDLALSDARPLKESLALLRATAKEYRHHD
ncbi:helix-turn-helix domain-containing protein [Streptomyces hyaluromycini]|uniref:helix-turn-helix domain-containing protein n=1 Tax=Streptomyces hyaluromycini TaxID=1377993 RepID=UPI000B5C6A45|nr:helix-turn-helix transcriptional regulator [Streptomyces hyaluromycini]